jgi:hypothetical protein
MTMPRFYFDVCEGVRFIPDDQGLELDGLEVAERIATRAKMRSAIQTMDVKRVM